MGAGTSSGKTGTASVAAAGNVATATNSASGGASSGTLTQRIQNTPFTKSGNTSTLQVTENGPYGFMTGTATIAKTPQGYHVEVSVNDGMPTTRIDLREYQMSESQREAYVRNILKNRMA